MSAQALQIFKMDKKELRNFISSIVGALLVSIVIFFILQGFFVDQIDEFIKSDLNNEVTSKITILNFVIFTYEFLLFITFMITFTLIVRIKGIEIILVITIIFTLITMYAICYLGLKIKYPQIIGPQYFVTSLGLFMSHVLGSQIAFYFILVGIFITYFIVLTIIFR
jgi:hypothetical protein